ncbi:DUF3967 domain-containing protein [Bacillus suaedae]|uniref:DUF3967 domain-containing protein n=1 Tax=Halalkalibacter suaedae TaxID=2822140 RepID=A0A940WWC8_9BACI|nr:DUF3967 domain-containing protein [Bacillus suaedae]MBP3953630.1 DUF3967 domain-containing protein [Bacillus suaedae]
MEEYNEKAYSTKEISEHLEIGTSTLRKWCLSLEENGYDFARTEGNKRLFVEGDLVSLKYFKRLVQDERFSMENASKVIISRHSSKASESRTPSVLPQDDENKRSNERSDEMIQQLLEHMKKQEERMEQQEKFNKELLERLDRQQTYIEERLNERDNTLIQSLREVQETKQLIAAAKEEENKKGFFARIFGNK